MQKQLGYIGIDQYGQHYHIDKHPRKELCEQIGIQHAEKMYQENSEGNAVHTGYVIAGRWISIYRIMAWN